ncbi:MAG: type I-F CRISPR-associated protein Csy2 [Burkholderiaceae bacterium]
MKSLLIFSHIEVENANAIAGLTWGFPAISNFLGFAHALSRKLNNYCGLTLGGCAVVCHRHDVQAYQPSGWGDYVFALTRNPLTKEAKSPAFVEEGRMYLDISLVIECDFKHHELDFPNTDDTDEAQEQHLIDWLYRQALMQRLAGGSIRSMRKPEYETSPLQNGRKLLMQLLPGYFLVDRREILQRHHEKRLAANHRASLLDSWTDFVAITYKAHAEGQEGELTDESAATWERLPRPGSGWLVPISVGFKAISTLYQPGAVLRTRDVDTPFRFVESVYSIGQWISPHRIHDLASVFWHYQQDGGWYLCRNDFSQSHQTQASFDQGV